MTISELTNYLFSLKPNLLINTKYYWNKKNSKYNLDYEEIITDSIIKLIDKWSLLDEIEINNLFNLEREQHNTNKKYLENYLYKTVNNAIINKIKVIEYKKKKENDLKLIDNTIKVNDEKLNLIEICLINLLNQKTITEADMYMFNNYFSVNDDLKKLYKKTYYKVKTKVINKLKKYGRIN